jgi:hypothetical protein
MAFEFTMIDKARIVVDCEISSTAMDHLAGTKGTMPDEKEAQFLYLRDTIEGIAADIFDEEVVAPAGMIRIFYHHVRYREPR